MVIASLISKGGDYLPLFLLEKRMSYKDTLCVNFVVKHKERLPYGNKDRGRYVKGGNGRRDIFVPSFGTMEKEEIDYVVEVAQEQEDERLKRPEKTPQKENLEYVANEMLKAPKGKRAKTAREIIDGR